MLTSVAALGTVEPYETLLVPVVLKMEEELGSSVFPMTLESSC